MSVVTRFAPSPTGMLHIGGARTALFNYLFARRNGGRFLLRIEDTDRERSTQEATDAILDAMEWLGLTPDEPPVMQSAQVDRHAAVAHDMVARGTAFRCYVTPEELQARRDLGEEKRQAAKQEGISDAEKEALLAEASQLLAPFRSPYRDGASPPSPDAPFTVRLRAPESGPRTVEDGVQGTVTIDASEIDDLVMLRADGTPTYMLAVVVDDHDMGITHVIRGDDHLRNTFRQVPIYEAMGWSVPNFSHVPMIHGNDGAKLSKRHGALSTTAYRDMGYLPEAMKAYLLRLGWSHGDQEIFTDEEAVQVFDVSGINKAPARLDLDKLATVNAHFMRLAADERLFDLICPVLSKNCSLSDAEVARIRAALPHMKDRGSTLIELANAFAFLYAKRPLELNKNAVKALSDEGKLRLKGLYDDLQRMSQWSGASISETIKSYCAATGLSMGQIGPPLRAALTGGLPAPDLAPVMDWLGREETLARIDDQLAG
ncbi:glutamyl-tRNA synthetase [Hyphomonas neptunium ATCC 15444]|uniref:Glutamate--tRNA ligase 1 n=2 Tax=Hyphomonas TaxID=85 RepID=SYE1_HYPNA|nr:RecName: Full=Glutamate--tRNA ligase 1; AltName: Full=Glutamyl-tRNA synthetase 1; Short=GluRS 1 [Hyphomonas neptunium ATCC 15444]ABI77242.1 glutamyl-tRNA synthetase [Hyphomonas neptunium ATCC 15444]